MSALSAGGKHSVQIEPVSEANSALVRELYLAQLKDTFAWLPAQGLAALEKDWTTDLLISRASDTHRVLRAAFRSAEEPVGFVFGAPGEGGVATVIWLAVRSDCRGAGIGRDLFNEAVAAYRELGCHKLRLYAKTPDSIDFYRRVGMIVEGEHRRHWWGVDCWSMAMFI